jgi:inner membrane protein
MATPVGHYLLGLSVTRLLANDAKQNRQGVWLAVVACLPDFDAALALFAGSIGEFHRGPSHSFTAAVAFAGLGWLVSKLHGARPSGRMFFLLGVLYASHLILDFFTLDTGAPHGVPFFWPVTDKTYMSPWVLLPNVQHTRRPLVSLHNLFAMVRECLLFLPLVGLVQAVKSMQSPKLAWLYAAWFIVATGASLASFR